MTREITCRELKDKLESGEPVSVVDVREADEYGGWHIDGSLNLPVYEALRRADDGQLRRRAGALPRDRPVVAVCRAGIVSRRAATILDSMGFDAQSLAGGIRGWGGVWSEARIALPSRPEAVLIQVRRNGKGCLSYLLGAAGEAAVIDPCVDVEAYTEIAGREGLRIGRVLETHVHADHLSRARALCRAVGAELLLPRTDRVNYPYRALDDGDRLTVGGVPVEVLATPGHTGESVCYRVAGEALLSGDTLFVESVGRPDLEQGDAGAEAGARRLHDSLRRLLDRAGEVHVYPAHHGRGIGFDGRAIGAPLAELSTRLTLLHEDEQSFVETILRSLSAKPPNHARIIATNEGKHSLDGLDPLDLEAGPNRCAAT